MILREIIPLFLILFLLAGSNRPTAPENNPNPPTPLFQRGVGGFSWFFVAWKTMNVSQENPGKYIPDQLLVKFKPQISKEEIDNINKKFGCKVIKYISDQRLYLIELPKGASVREMIDSYQQIPQVEYVEPNYLINLP